MKKYDDPIFYNNPLMRVMVLMKNMVESYVIPKSEYL